MVFANLKYYSGQTFVRRDAKDSSARWVSRRDAQGRTVQFHSRCGIWTLRSDTHSDEATTKELAVIQGPPGTGKTFTSVVILESLVQTQRVCHEALVYPAPKRPVIIVAQTNHALDQLLMRYMETQGSGAVVRLGSRTSCEAIEKRTLFNLAKKGSRKGRRRTALCQPGPHTSLPQRRCR